MKWMMLLYQEGGCDYTIGCGRKWIMFNAGTKEEAHTRARKTYSEYNEISELTLVQIAEEDGKPVIFKSNIKAWDREADEEAERREREEEERKERAEFDRLSKKFGKPSG
jgi:hypothetical protein